MYCCDGNDAQKTLLAESGEPLTKLTQWNLNFGDGGRPFSITENRQLNIIRDTLKQEYTDFLNENKIDFIISPAYNNVAPRPEEIYNWSYTSLFNILDLPTLAFQTGLFQDPKVDKWDDSHSTYEFRSDLEKLELDNYIPENFTGAPIGLQLSGRRYFDEEVVAAGKSITKALGADLYKVY
ncbi:amidase signature enzyme [Hyphopichia burtonii NRRL Y-1933]|uniref:Amidase signature enzyme n=2 Tax=Dikarya TaxID=451864 RepID=A0A1E4RNJ8_9ASCO|nr:amidase signature enzyme [Hyphopichia burtonii NRRL Y-1933]ODV68848.1 amidase signature enzyme [Hyphopichia burtonii NRRL Y-1933]